MKNLTRWKFKRGLKSGIKTPEYYVMALAIGALQHYMFSKGPEPIKRAREVGVVSAVLTIGTLVVINGVSVLIYNRTPNQNN